MKAHTYQHRRLDAVTRVLKIQLRQYPEHVVYQALREARRVLSADPQALGRAMREAQLHAWIRFATASNRGRRA